MKLNEFVQMSSYHFPSCAPPAYIAVHDSPGEPSFGSLLFQLVYVMFVVLCQVFQTKGNGGRQCGVRLSKSSLCLS